MASSSTLSACALTWFWRVYLQPTPRGDSRRRIQATLRREETMKTTVCETVEKGAEIKGVCDGRAITRQINGQSYFIATLR